MIIDCLKNLRKYGPLHHAFATAADFIESGKLSTLPIGRTDIDRDRLFVIRADNLTKETADSVWEVHRTYGDIHLLLTGEERIGYAPIHSMTATTDYDAEKDYQLFAGSGEFFTLRSCSFCIVGPDDVHMPGQSIDGKPARVEKLVFKWRVIS